MIKQFAADPVSHNNRAHCLSKLRNMREATDPNAPRRCKFYPKRLGFRANLALFADYSGDFQAAEREVKALQEPTDNAVLALAFAELGQGLPQDALETYKKLGTMSARGASWAASAPPMWRCMKDGSRMLSRLSTRVWLRTWRRKTTTKQPGSLLHWRTFIS